MNLYLYTVQVVRVGMLQNPTEDEARIAQEHLDYMQGLFDDGMGIFSGALQVRDSRHFGLVIYQAEDDTTAAQIVHNDPAVKSRMMRGCWYPFRIPFWNSEAFTLTDGQQHFFYHIQPVRPEALTEGPTEFEEQATYEHAAYLKDLVDKGICCVVGRTLTQDYSTFGMAIFRADNEKVAWRISEDDPGIVKRLMRLDVQPFKISLCNENFSLD